MNSEAEEILQFTLTLDPMEIFPYIFGEELTKEQEQKWLDWKAKREAAE